MLSAGGFAPVSAQEIPNDFGAILRQKLPAVVASPGKITGFALYYRGRQANGRENAWLMRDTCWNSKAWRSISISRVAAVGRGTH